MHRVMVRMMMSLLKICYNGTKEKKHKLDRGKVLPFAQVKGTANVI